MSTSNPINYSHFCFSWASYQKLKMPWLRQTYLTTLIQKFGVICLLSVYKLVDNLKLNKHINMQLR